MARARPRRLVLVALVLFLAALGGGLAYVLSVGRSRTDPIGQAAAARKAGDVAAAEAQLHGLLEADASHVRARSLLIEILATSGRFEEAERFARHWLADPDTEGIGLRTLSELAFQRNDAPMAVRFARMVADRDPAFSLAMLVQVQDFLGTPTDREGSVRAAEALGLLAKVPETRANAFLYAAETLRDLEADLPDGPLKSAYADRRERNRRAARDAAQTPQDLNAPPRESLSARKARRGRIQLLSDDTSERQKAVEMLEGLLEAEPDTYDARASLVAHLVAQGEVERAVAHARLLGEASPLLSIRAISSLARVGARAAALGLLDATTAIPARARELLRTRLLVAGDEHEREQGLLAFERLVRESPSDLALVREGYRRIQEAGDPERALHLLEDAASREPKLLVSARVERVAEVSQRADRADLDRRLAELASAATTADLLGVYSRLQRIPEVGGSLGLVFLERVLEAGRVDPNELRLVRAAITSSRPATAPDGRGWDEWTREDLAAIAADSHASVRILVKAATLAVAADAHRLVGILLARALAHPLEGDAALALYLHATSDPDGAGRDLAAQGMRASAARDSELGAWIAALADALARGDTTSLRRRSRGGSPFSGPALRTELLLQLALATRAADAPQAEAFARELLAAAPGEAEGTVRLGAVLLGAGKFEETLALHGTAQLTPEQRAQRVRALRGLGRQEGAVAEARLLVRETEGSDRALLVLGRLLRDGDPDAALAAVSPGAGSLEVDLLRGELLEQRGEEDAAVEVYEDMLRASGNRNLGAWQGLARVRAAQDRDGSFVKRLTSAIDAAPRGTRDIDLAPLVLLRGQAHERKSDYEQALRDYLRVIETLPKHPVALNNAAWLMSAHIVRRPEEAPKWNEQALALADRAVAAAPDLAPIHHTRAKILVALQRTDDALAAFDRALELTTASLEPHGAAGRRAADIDLLRGRLARYLLDEGSLLEAKGDVERAKTIYRRVQHEHAGTYPALLAQEALGRLGG